MRWRDQDEQVGMMMVVVVVMMKIIFLIMMVIMMRRITIIINMLIFPTVFEKTNTAGGWHIKMQQTMNRDLIVDCINL